MSKNLALLIAGVVTAFVALVAAVVAISKTEYHFEKPHL